MDVVAASYAAETAQSATTHGSPQGGAATNQRGGYMHYRKHIRLPNYDYSQNGYYFVTICTYMRRPIFVNVPLSTVNIKFLVQQKIKQIPDYYQGVEIDYNEVMPTHVHMILILCNANTSLPKIINAFKSWVTRDINRVAAASYAAETARSRVAAASYAAETAKTARSAAQGAATTTNKILIWQPNYYEHIIRNESALNRIREYIMNNPEKETCDWDKLNM